MSFTFVTLTHTYGTAADLPASGKVVFTPIAPMHNGPTVISAPVTATLSTLGVLSQVLAANTDPATVPTGTVYRVVEKITGQPDNTYYIQVPHDQGPTINLAVLNDWVGGGPAGTFIATINGDAPDGSGNLALSAADVGAQPADADLTGLANLADGVPVRAAGTWGLASGTRDGTRFLRDDGTWQTVATGGGGAVSSVNGQTGAVVLTSDSLADGSSKVQMTTAERSKLAGVASGATNYVDEQAQDAAASLLLAGVHTGVSASYVDSLNRLDLTVSGGSATPTAHPTDPTLYSFGATQASPATAPGTPTITSVTPGSGQVTVAFTPPASNGGAAISSYTAVSSPGGFTGTSPSSPIVVTGLANGTAYTFQVTATNSVGTGPASGSSSSVTPTASGAGSSSPGTSTPARWWIPFGSAPHCRVTYDTGVVAGQAQVVWVASMPDVRVRSTPRETGVAAQTQDAWQAYVQDLSTGLTVADSGTVLGTASSWTATTFTPVAGRRYKGFARVRATDGQWSAYGATRFVAPTGVTKFFEDFGMVGDGTTQSGTDYGASIFQGPLRAAISACSPGDVLKSNAPGTIVTASSSGTTLTAATSVFTSGMVGKKIMVYGGGSKTTSTDAYVHRTTVASFTSGTQITLTAAPTTAVTNAKCVIGYPEFKVGHIDMDGGANSQGGVTIDGTGCLFTSTDPDHAGFRTAGITDMTYKNIHYWVKNVTIRGNGQNNNNCPWFVENPATTGGRIIGCYAEHTKDAGFMFFGGASDWHVVDCTADHTFADPFHVTGSATDIQFIRNVGVYVGDDGTANIGYRTDGDAARPQRITWESPTITGQDWGRGLSFGGAKDVLATDVTTDKGAGASFLIGSDGDQANTEHVQVRRFTVTNPKTRAGLHPTYTQGGGTTATVNDDACIKLLNIGSTVRQRDILIEDGTITDPGFAVQVVVSGTAGFQDGTIIIRGITLNGTVNTGTGWLDQATWNSHIDFRGITVPAASTPASAPTAANS